MPVDDYGNRADMIIYGITTFNRMNNGRLYEQFINAATRDLLRRLKELAALPHDVPLTDYQVSTALQSGDLVTQVFDTLLRYYQIVAPKMVEYLSGDEDPGRHVYSVLKEGIFLYMPPNNPVNNLEMVRELYASEFCPVKTPVTYTDATGRRVRTKDEVLIGSLYIMMLEKTGEDWSGVSSVKTQHFGVPAKLSNYDKQGSPGRQAPVRALGESETRSYICTVGPEATMELIDQSNSPTSHREAVGAILRADKPTNIDQVIDRNKIPFGGSRPVQFVNHLLRCRGMKFTYAPSEPSENEVK